MKTSSLQLISNDQLRAHQHRQANKRGDGEIKPDRVERRVVTRVPSRERFYIQITACLQNADLLGARLACNALDISFSGIKMRCAEFIPSGCRLKVWFDNGLQAGKYLLQGEVRWMLQVDPVPADYLLGVFLDTGASASASTDIEAWQGVYWL